MGFSGPGSSYQHGIALVGQESAGGQIANQPLVDRRFGKVERRNFLGQRQLGDRHLIFDRARLLLIDLGLQQIADHAAWAMLSLYRIGDHLIIGVPHARELERPHHLQDLVAFHRTSSGYRNGRSRRRARDGAGAPRA